MYATMSTNVNQSRTVRCLRCNGRAGPLFSNKWFIFRTKNERAHATLRSSSQKAPASRKVSNVQMRRFETQVPFFFLFLFLSKPSHFPAIIRKPGNFSRSSFIQGSAPLSIFGKADAGGFGDLDDVTLHNSRPSQSPSRCRRGRTLPVSVFSGVSRFLPGISSLCRLTEHARPS